MPKERWKFYITFGLTALTLVLALLHVAIFGDARTLEFYLALDIVFVPVQVLLVTVIIERFLREREQQAKLYKLNMVIGAFMGEVGTELLRKVDRFSSEAQEYARQLAVRDSWHKPDFAAARAFAAAHPGRFEPTPTDFVGLRDFLLARRPFILGLLQNPNLLEHDQFTDLLWAVCHLTEELECRPGFDALPESDHLHLRGDIRRAYVALLREWLSYMEHLKSDYPYIFSLAVRTNPFIPDASPIVYP